MAKLNINIAVKMKWWCKLFKCLFSRALILLVRINFIPPEVAYRHFEQFLKKGFLCKIGDRKWEPLIIK